MEIVWFDEFEGYTLLAPKSFWDALKHHPEEIDKYCGGCGPGKFGAKIIPDSIFGEKITPACKIHDWTYHVQFPKDYADAVFHMNMDLIVRSDKSFFDHMRLNIVEDYYEAVSFYGQDAYDRAGEEE